MAYEDEQKKRSRVVIETPTARREVTQQSTHVPDRGMSGGTVAALVVGAVALVVILFLFYMNRQNDDAASMNARVASTQPTPAPQTTIIQQPAQPLQQPPVIVQAPAASQPAPIVVSPPADSTSSTATTSGSLPNSNVSEDFRIQADIDKKISASPTLSSLGVIATVLDGKVTLSGTVETADIKRQALSLVRGVKGVRGIDDHIVVTGSGPNSNAP